MTVDDRCTATYPHPAHRTDYGPFGVRDCPGVPVTPANAPAVPDGPAPASTPPQTNLEWAVRNLERNVGRLFARLDEHLSITHGPTDDEDAQAAVQNMLDDATRAFAVADTSSERVEVLRDLLADWYAAWPETAVTDPHEPIAWQIASLISAAEARASEPRLFPRYAAAERLIRDRGTADLGSPADRGVGITPPHPPAEMVWLGDLSGYTLEPDHDGVVVRHRCGWTYELTQEVMGYLANLLDGPVAAHRRAGCVPREQPDPPVG